MFGQQLQRAGKARNDVDDVLQVVRLVEHAEFAHGVGLANERLDHQVRALVGRAQHQKACAAALHQLVPQLGVLVHQRAHHQAAHAVGQHAHGLRERDALSGGGVQLLAQHLGQLIGQHVHGQTPVVGMRHDAVAGLQVLVQIAVKLREQGLGADVVFGRAGFALYLGQAAHQQRRHAEPHAITLLQPQV